MNAKDAIKLAYDMERMVTMAYVDDLSDVELMMRPGPGLNHIKWQLGHLISAEHAMIEKALPGSMPALPEGFAARYSKETAASDAGDSFDSKDVLLAAARAQRAGTLKALDDLPESRLEDESGIHYAPTLASLFSMQASHWLMHAGQWVVVRRQLGRPPLF